MDNKSQNKDASSVIEQQNGIISSLIEKLKEQNKGQEPVQLDMFQPDMKYKQSSGASLPKFLQSKQFKDRPKQIEEVDKPVESEKTSISILGSIYKLMEKDREDFIRNEELEKTKKKDDLQVNDKKHHEIISAFKEVAEKEEEVPEEISKGKKGKIPTRKPKKLKSRRPGKPGKRGAPSRPKKPKKTGIIGAIGGAAIIGTGAALKPKTVPGAKPSAPSGEEKKKVESTGDAKPVKVGSEQGKKAMVKAMDDAKISDKTQRAAIMAQVSHESGGFSVLSENLNYKAPTLLKLFPKKFKSPDDAQQVASGGPQSVAERIYGGRMGNAPEGGGEGFEYRGRGFIQLTGKQNYKRFGVDSNPDSASTVPKAAEIAIKYMAGFKGDWSNIGAVTKFVNGGNIGLADREKQFQAFLNDPTILKDDGSSLSSSPTASPAPGDLKNSQVASASDTNKNLKDDMKGQKQQVAVVNTTVNNNVTNKSSPPPKPSSEEDKSGYLRKSYA